MLDSFTWIDVGLIVLYVAIVVAIGAYHLRRQQDGDEFFLAGRSLGWFPVGMSLTATLFAALNFSDLPADGYLLGWGVLWLLLPLAIAGAIAGFMFVPWYRELNLESVYALLEQRFGASVRLVCALLFIAWRLLWTGAVIHSAGQLIREAAGAEVPEWSTVLLIGLATTAYTYLGGMRAVVWTDVAQVAAIGIAALVLLGAVWPHAGSSSGFWTLVEGPFSRANGESFGPRLVQGTVLLLALYATDQITVQRFLAAREARAARSGLVLHLILTALLICALGAVGVGMRGRLVAARSKAEREIAVTRTDKAPTVAGKSTARPFAPGNQGPIFSNASNADLLPRFVATQLSPVARTTVLIALLAAAMSTFDSALNSIGAVIVVDLHRRFGVGRRWLADHQRKPAEKLTSEDELALAKPLTWLVGVAATGISLSMGGAFSQPFYFLVSLLNAMAAPLLGLFLLAALSWRCSARGALTALISGMAVVAVFMTADFMGPADLGRVRWENGDALACVAGLLTTLGLGVALSLGRRSESSRMADALADPVDARLPPAVAVAKTSGETGTARGLPVD
jgi:SSS family transporter